MTTRKDGAHLIMFPKPFVNPLDGGTQKSILVGKDDYEALKKRAKKINMPPARYITYLLSQGISPFAQKAANSTYVEAALYALKD